MRAVEERQAFLGLEDERPEASARERFRRRNLAASVRRGAFADEAERDVRERRQVSRGADRPELRHHGMNPPIQARDHGFDDERPHAGGAARERGGEQEHDRADLGRGKRRAHAAGVAQHEIALELGTLARWNDNILELAHAGRDPVDGLGACRQPVDEGARFAERPGGGRAEPHLLAAAGDCLDHLERERATVQLDHGARSRARPTPAKGSGTRHPRVSSRTRARSSGSSTVARRPDSTTRRPWTQTSVTARSDIA